MPNQIAYGFHSLLDVFGKRINDVNNGLVLTNDAVRASAAEYSRQQRELFTALVEETTEEQEGYKGASSGTLQPLDEWGNPDPELGGETYKVAFPIQGAGTAWGDNRVSRAEMTVEEANDLTVAAQKKDADWMIRHALAALFSNTSWTFKDPKKDDLVIKGLANGDTDKYSKKNGAFGIDTHYVAQAAAISDGANPFSAIVANLVEHDINAGAPVIYVATDLAAQVKGLTELLSTPDQNVTQGISAPQLNSSGEGGIAFGDSVIGYLKSARAWVVEWGRLSSGYGFAKTLGGRRPIKQRNYRAAELQGFFTEFHSPDGNREVKRFLRYAGFGCANRVGAVAFQIGNASYSAPADLTAPLPR